MSEVENIPKHWDAKTLGEVCEIQTGKYDANHAKPSGKFRFYTCAFEYMFCDTNRFKGESLILPGNGANVGEVFYYNGDFDAYQRTYVLNGIKTHPKYLFYHLLCNWKKRNQDKQFGSATNYIRMANFTDYVVPVPPLPEQHRIVAKIEELFSSLDKGIESLKTAQQQLKVYRQAVLKWAFEGKLTRHFDRLSDQPVEPFAEPVEANGVVEATDKEVELPKGDALSLPKGWKWVKVSEISNVVRGGSPRPAGDPKYYDGTIPFLKVRDITKDNGTYLTTFEYTIKEAGLHKTRQIRPNTLLLSNSGATLGVPKICMIDATMNDGIAAFLDLEARSNLYLYYFWLSKTKELRNINMGAAQPNLNTDIIKNYLVPYCSFEEQQLIVAEIESRLSVCDKIEESIEQCLQQSESLRQSILKQAFAGQLVPQDPNDEPAAKLLERIKAGKEALKEKR